MNFLKRLANLFSGGGAPTSDKRYLTIYALSRRCNEPVSGQVDLLNELSKPDDEQYAYFTRKVLHTTGERRCFAQVEITVYFNQDKRVVEHEVEGGRWLTSEEYTEELARFNAPPPEEAEADVIENTAVPETTLPHTSSPDISSPDINKLDTAEEK
jgi:hypothetical protein